MVRALTMRCIVLHNSGFGFFRILYFGVNDNDPLKVVSTNSSSYNSCNTFKSVSLKSQVTLARLQFTFLHRLWPYPGARASSTVPENPAVSAKKVAVGKTCARPQRNRTKGKQLRPTTTRRGRVST